MTDRPAPDPEQFAGTLMDGLENEPPYDPVERGSLSDAIPEIGWKPLEPWRLSERYGDYRTGFWLLFSSGERRLGVEVTKEQWDAFGS